MPKKNIIPQPRIYYYGLGGLFENPKGGPWPPFEADTNYTVTISGL